MRPEKIRWTRFLRKRSVLLARIRPRGGVLVLDVEVPLFWGRLRTSAIFTSWEIDDVCAETSF